MKKGCLEKGESNVFIVCLLLATVFIALLTLGYSFIADDNPIFNGKTSIPEKKETPSLVSNETEVDSGYGRFKIDAPEQESPKPVPPEPMKEETVSEAAPDRATVEPAKETEKGIASRPAVSAEEASRPAPAQKPATAAPAQDPAAPATAGPVKIKGFAFHRSGPGREGISIRADRSFAPKVFTLDGVNPYGANLRLVVDIKGAAFREKGLSKMAVNGALIKQIRSRFYNGKKLLRIVLDMDSSKAFQTKRYFDQDENVYVIELLDKRHIDIVSAEPAGQAGQPTEIASAGKRAEIASAEPVRRAGQPEDVDSTRKDVRKLEEIKKEKPSAVPDSDKKFVTIKGIHFRKTKSGGEAIFIHSDGFFEPNVFGLDRDNPFGTRVRLVIDIKNTSFNKEVEGVSKVAVGGKLIKQIRSHFYPYARKLRIVLDLASTKTYMAEQTFYKADNVYRLELREDKESDFSAEGIPEQETGAPNMPVQGPETKDWAAQDGTGQEVEDQGREVAGKESKPETVKLASIDHPDATTWDAVTTEPIPTTSSVQLRVDASDLNQKALKKMLLAYNFYSTCGGYNSKFCNPRGSFENIFVDNRDGTISDLSTGLMWEKGGSPDVLNWKDAKGYVADLNRRRFAGHGDWRLPTIEELASLVENSWKNRELFIDSLFDPAQRSCWSIDVNGSDRVWKTNFHLGYNIDTPSMYANSVRAVRSVPYSDSLARKE